MPFLFPTSVCCYVLFAVAKASIFPEWFKYFPDIFLHQTLKYGVCILLKLSNCLWLDNVVPDGANWHHIAKSQTNGFIEKRYSYEFTISNNIFFILNKVFDILNF